MAVVNTKATPLSNADSDPQETTHSYEVNGYVRSSTGSVVKASADSNNSVYRFVRLPSNARLIGRTLENDAITGMTDVNIGVYDVDDGAAVDDNLLEDALTLASAGAAFAPFGQIAPENKGKRLWELLGLTEDPQIQYDIAATAIAAGAGAGDIAMDILWTN